MSRLSLITISMHELDRVKIIEAVLGRRMKPGQAAKRLQLTTRQIERLVKRYQTEGPVGLVSRRRGRPSNRELPADLHARVLALIRERYADFGPTLAGEKLYESHGIRLAKETAAGSLRWCRG